MAAPGLSVVIPVYNEEAVLPSLFARLYPALDALGESYEVIFVNDGSTDRSAALLREQFQKRPDATRVILFSGNYGQHMAIVAGFERCRGDRVVTLDADLQNPPEEIAKLLAKMDEGYDYIGAAINSCREVNTFIPALAYTFAQRPTEIEVAHEERAAGESKYSLYKLVQLNFDLVTSFSVKPLHLFSLLGMFIALAAVLAYVVVIAERWVLADSVAEGLRAIWDRDILEFFLIGILLFGLGLLGEYIGRIYEQVRQRPRYVVQAVLEQKE